MDEKKKRGPERKSRQEQIREITDRLEEGVKEVFESDKYREMLKCMSKFHHYSLNNCLLIAMQYPSASLVAGYRTWQKEFDRQVRKGEKGIRILAPCRYKVEKDAADDGDKEIIEITGFRVISVFAYEQTEGRELPMIGVNELTGDVKNYHKLFNALKDICPVPICSEDIQGGANGYYDDGAKRIAIRSGMSQVQTIKTMIHEISHQRLHSKENMDEEKLPDRSTKEVEAESIAYTVCSHFGLDTADYTFGYVAGWSSGKDTKELKNSLERIRKTADEMITSIDQAMEKQREKSERIPEYERT